MQIKFISLFLLLLVVVSPALADSGGYIISPQDQISPDNISGVDSSGADGNETFMDLPLWVQISEISGTLVALLILLKYLPAFIGRTIKYQQNGNRTLILDYINDNPGTNLSEIKDALQINRGTLTYHINILGSTHKISIQKRGKRAYLFYNSGRYTETQKDIMILSKNDVRKETIQTIRDSPGVTNKQLADSIGIDKGTVSWHIKILKNTDIISEEIAKNQRNYFLK